LLILSSCGKEEQQATPQGPAKFAVKNYHGGRHDIPRFHANIEGQQNVEIRPKVNGFIQKIYVDEGQTVRKFFSN
jgi:membrane fusion protein (multidrug efflux system)